MCLLGVGVECIPVCEEGGVRLCLSPDPSPGPSQIVMAVLMLVLGQRGTIKGPGFCIFKANVSCHVSLCEYSLEHKPGQPPLPVSFLKLFLVFQGFFLFLGTVRRDLRWTWNGTRGYPSKV